MNEGGGKDWILTSAEIAAGILLVVIPTAILYKNRSDVDEGDVILTIIAVLLIAILFQVLRSRFFEAPEVHKILYIIKNSHNDSKLDIKSIHEVVKRFEAGRIVEASNGGNPYLENMITYYADRILEIGSGEFSINNRTKDGLWRLYSDLVNSIDGDDFFATCEVPTHDDDIKDVFESEMYSHYCESVYSGVLNGRITSFKKLFILDNGDALRNPSVQKHISAIVKKIRSGKGKIEAKWIIRSDYERYGGRRLDDFMIWGGKLLVVSQMKAGSNTLQGAEFTNDAKKISDRTGLFNQAFSMAKYVR